jgi:hypothetical protein
MTRASYITQIEIYSEDGALEATVTAEDVCAGIALKEGLLVSDSEDWRSLSAQIGLAIDRVTKDGGALGLVADLRKALGDPLGRLMQDELVAHAAALVAERDRLRADVAELVELAAETVNEWDLRIVDGDDYAACKRVIENTMAPLRALLAKHQPLQALQALADNSRELGMTYEDKT